MANTILSRAVHCVLDPTSPPVDPATQRRIASWAMHHDDVDTIIALLNRPELTCEVDDLFASDKRAKIRAAWLSRPGRPNDELNNLLRSEKRETVLAAVAATPELDPEIYHAIIAQCSGLKPLLEILVADRPLDVRRSAIRALTNREGKLTKRESSRLNTIINSESELRIEVLQTGRRRRLLLEAFAHASDDELLECDGDRLLDLIVLSTLNAYQPGADPLRVDQRYISALKSAVKDAYRLLVSVPSLEARRGEVVSKFEEHIAPRWPTNDAGAHNWLRDSVDELKERPTVSGKPLEELRAALYDGTQKERSHALDVLLQVKHDTASGRYASQVVVAAALDGKLDGKLHDVLSITHYSYICSLGARLTRRGSLTVDAAVVVAQHAANPAAVYSALEACEEPREALEAYLTHPRTNALRLAKFLSVYSLDDPELIPKLPARVLARGAYTSQSGQSPFLKEASAYILDRLGDDPGRWRLFEELSEGSASTIGDLFDLIELTYVN